jgi:hypothetical protein
MGQDSLNRDVFDRCFAGRLLTVLRGGTSSLFCYGYTGSGKTHTVIGYGQERGVFYLAAEQLLEQMRALEQQEGKCLKVTNRETFLLATACEVYNNELYDLLGEEKLPASLRVDERGQLKIVGQSRQRALDPSESGMLEGVDAASLRSSVNPETMMVENSTARSTTVTRSSGLRSVAVRQASELQELAQTCVQSRAAGTSTEHAQSSRSHAILRLDVVNNAMIEITALLEDAKALLPARQNAVSNMRACIVKELFEEKPFSSIRRNDLQPTSEDEARVTEFLGIQASWAIMAESDGEWIVESQRMAADGKRFLWTLVGRKGETELEELLDELGGRDKLRTCMVLKKVTFEEKGKWPAELRRMLQQLDVLEEKVNAAEDDVERLHHALAATMKEGPAHLGGSLLMVDLAGADYDHREGAQQKESAEINKSLLALKECFRSLSGASTTRPKFRASKLTRILQDALAPSQSSTRINHESVSVMMVNIAPCSHLEKMTLNTLRYGQMFASSTSSASRASGSTARTQRTHSHIQKSSRQKEHAREELLRIYSEHCPTKSSAEVECILLKFAGRETALLCKVRAKYLTSNPDQAGEARAGAAKFVPEAGEENAQVD